MLLASELILRRDIGLVQDIVTQQSPELKQETLSSKLQHPSLELQ